MHAAASEMPNICSGAIKSLSLGDKKARAGSVWSSWRLIRICATSGDIFSDWANLAASRLAGRICQTFFCIPAAIFRIAYPIPIYSARLTCAIIHPDMSISNPQYLRRSEKLADANLPLFFGE